MIRDVAPTRGEQVRQADDDAAALLAEYVRTEVDTARRQELRTEVIRALLPLARNLALRYHGRDEPLDDLVQTATIGLINAVDRFDPGFGIDFVGYAVPPSPARSNDTSVIAPGRFGSRAGCRNAGTR